MENSVHKDRSLGLGFGEYLRINMKGTVVLLLAVFHEMGECLTLGQRAAFNALKKRKNPEYTTADDRNYEGLRFWMNDQPTPNDFYGEPWRQAVFGQRSLTQKQIVQALKTKSRKNRNSNTNNGLQSYQSYLEQQPQQDPEEQLRHEIFDVIMDESGSRYFVQKPINKKLSSFFNGRSASWLRRTGV